MAVTSTSSLVFCYIAIAIVEAIAADVADASTVDASAADVVASAVNIDVVVDACVCLFVWVGG